MAAGLLQMIPFFGPFVSWAPPVIVALVLQPESVVPTLILMGLGWIVVMNVLQPRIMQGAVGIHPIVVLGSVLIGGRIAGIPGAIFGIPFAAVVSAFVIEFLHRTSGDRSVAGRAARRLEERDGRPVRIPREPVPGSATDIDEPDATGDDRSRRPGPGQRADMTDDRSGTDEPAGDGMDMTRERARTERRDLDKERGEPLAGGTARGGPRALGKGRRAETPSSGRPRILVTNDDGVESRGLLALKQALEGIGDVTVVAPDTNQSAVGHQKTLMRPLRVRERDARRRLARLLGRRLPDRRGQPRLPRLLRHGFDLVAAGINYGANLGDDITYSGTVSAAMEAVINNCPAFAISQEYYAHPDFALAARAATAVARNILEHGLSRRRAHQRQRPGRAARRVRRGRGHPARQARLPGPAHRAARPARHPLLLDRRSAAVGSGRRGHRLPRGRQPAHRGHADPPRPDRPAAAQAAAHLGLGAARAPVPPTTSTWAGERPAEGVRTDRRTIRSRARRHGGSDDGRLCEAAEPAGRRVTPTGQPTAALGGLARRVQQGGGIDGLIDKLRAGGLGGAVDSWVSTGPNQPVAPGSSSVRRSGPTRCSGCRAAPA